MIIRRLWNYLIGYLVIHVEGLSLEKFMNLTISKGIYLWHVRRSNYTTLTACIGIKDFKKLPSIVRVVRCRVTIADKRGFPFLVHKLKKRKMLVAGMVLFLVGLYIISSFIWDIEIQGTKNVEQDRIMTKLQENGIVKGVFKGSISVPKIENQLMIDLPELSWIGIELKGTKAIIRVVEAVKPPAMLNKDTPCNILASKSGIIHKLTVLDGVPVVKEGDTVMEGQVLVSGIIEHEDTASTRYVHAMAKVLARTWYEGEALAYYKDLDGIRTGKVVKCTYLAFKDKIMELDKKTVNIKNYEVEEKKYPLFGEGRFFPIDYVVRGYYEVRDINQAQVRKRIVEKAQNMALREAYKKIPEDAKIIDKKFKYDMIEREGVKSIVYVEVLENIAVEDKILFEQEDTSFGQPTKREDS